MDARAEMHTGSLGSNHNNDVETKNTQLSTLLDILGHESSIDVLYRCP